MKTKKESMWVKRNGFRRLMGVKKGTFDKTAMIVRREEKKRRKRGGAKRKLSIENMVKMMFDCQGNTRTYYQIETVTTSAKVVDIDIKYVEEVLIKSGEYALGWK